VRFVQTRRGETADSGGLFVRDPKRETNSLVEFR
jgi:hypothetical protein